MKKILTLTSLLFTLTHSFSQSIIESNNQFAFDLFKEIKSTNENIIFSPASISSAFAMTYIGAKGNTFTEMSDVFHFNKDLSVFNADYKNLVDVNTDNKDLKFSNANSLWIQENLDLNSDFLNTSKTYYLSSTYFSDFVNNPEKSRLDINQWVEKNTNGKITNLLKPAAIDNGTRLVLVNAMYFKGAWKKHFNKDQNTEADFQISKKEFTKTIYMNNFIDTWYYEDSNSKVIDIPYKGDDISLMIIIPKSYKKIKRIEKNLDIDFYSNYIAKKEKRRVELSIPKFKIESDYELNKTLGDLGLRDAFTGNANFSGITEKEKLYISLAVHKATIEIDEEGTEAAAATAVVMRKTAMLLEDVDFKVDKPFIYILRNSKTNCIYFMGKVVNPNL